MKRLILTSFVLFGTIALFTFFTFNYTQASNFQTQGINTNHTTIRSADDPGAPWTGPADSNGGIPGAWGIHGGVGGGGGIGNHLCNTKKIKQ
ncbi:hypothetical protein [Desulfurella sp.]|uniref:hypothetical protein n=1 Tax=Desulfurella sp. TaxID=1962857 RepID=UPI0025BBE74A|nr:hypothetical protein [Desulfurella sp.]